MRVIVKLNLYSVNCDYSHNINGLFVDYIHNINYIFPIYMHTIKYCVHYGFFFILSTTINHKRNC